MIDENIKFDFRMLSVGLTDVDDFTDVVCEIRYHFNGQLNTFAHERYYVQNLDFSNLSIESFIRIEDVTQEQLQRWLEESIDPENLVHMKKAMHEQFYPPIRQKLPGLFKKESRS